MSRAILLLSIIVVSFNTHATEYNWHSAIGFSFSPHTTTIPGAPDNCTSSTTTLPYFLINYDKYPSFSYLAGYSTFKLDEIHILGDGQAGFTDGTYLTNFLKLGVLYDIFHNNNGWFVDGAVYYMKQISGDYPDRDLSHNRYELGFGKAFSRWIVRAAYGMEDQMSIDRSTVDMNYSSSSEGSIELDSKQHIISLGVSYWFN